MSNYHAGDKTSDEKKADNVFILMEFMLLGKLHNFSTFWFLQFCVE